MARMQIKKNDVFRAAIAGLALSLAAGPGLLSGPRVQAKEKPDSASAGSGQVEQKIGETFISADDLSYDLGQRQYLLKGSVKITSKQTHLTSDRMTIQLSPTNELEWAKGVGDVFIEKKNPEDGTLATGRGRTLDYFDKEQKANLQGDVVVNQTSPRLAKPAIITGSRVDMDLKSKVNVVYKSANAQAKVHLEPKGDEGKPAGAEKPAGESKAVAAGKASGDEKSASKSPLPPEPMDLVGDRIEMNSATQEYTSTGSPVLIRPSSRLQGRKIHFTVDNKTNEVQKAFADDDVVFDSQSDTGTVMHGTGDNAVYDKDANEVTLTGMVHATTKEPDDPAPTVYQGTKFIYNTVTRICHLSGKPGTIITPESKTQKSGGGKSEGPAGGAKTGSDEKKK